jgi:glycosyltransferase involved in cell wall biosynthesis
LHTVQSFTKFFIMINVHQSDNPQVSIIIPCYNHGEYLEEALNSIVVSDKGKICEVVIVNDGSTDSFTLSVLEELDKRGWKVIHQSNQGLAAARNMGIANTSAPFVLPLDSDNKLMESYLTNGLDLLNKTKAAAIYGDARYFGDRNGVWKNKPFKVQNLLLENHVDACALIRRENLLKVGGYSLGMPSNGYEDWDLWLKMIDQGFFLVYLPELCFEYRVLKNSMVKSLNKSRLKSNELLDYFYEKFDHLLSPEGLELFILSQFKKNPFAYMLKLLLKSYFPKIYNSLYRRNLVRKYF